MDAVVEAIAIQRHDCDAAIPVLARWLQTDDAEALAETWDFYTNKRVQRVPRLVPEQFTDAKAVLVSHNPRIADYDVNRLLDNSLADAAVTRGLARPE